MSPRHPVSPAAAGRLTRALAAGFERRLGEAACGAGFVSEAVLREAEGEQEKTGRPLAQILVERGALTVKALEELRTQVAHQEFSRPTASQKVEEPAEVSAAAADPTRRLGDFVLVAVLGRGGAGEVWRAWDRSLGRFVAVKIATAAALSSVARERFEKEVAATARLSHPGLVPVYRSGFENGRPYLVMPLVDGETLEGATLDTRRALQVVRAASLAVAHAHQLGVVHRDLKPGNMMVGKDGRVFVLDFGLAALREEGARTTQPGDVIGTAAYMAPEQARGRGGDSGPALDVYGLGATLYFLVTGQAPYEGASFAEVVARVGRGDLVSPRRWKPSIDRGLEAVILKAMAPDPRWRYASAAELAEDLRRLLDHEETSARPAGPLGRLALSVRRHPVQMGGAVVVLALLMGLGTWRLRLLAERTEAIETIREIARLSLDAALRLRRAGDAVGMRQMVPRLETAYQRARAQAPDLAEVEYLMGRMYRAVLDEDRALEHQNRALEKDPALLVARYERAVLLARRYGKAIDQALSWTLVKAAPGPVHAESRVMTTPEDAALADLRSRIVADLTHLRQGGGAQASVRAADGILAFYERDLQRARTLLTEVVRDDPFREEAWEALARTYETLGMGREAERTYTQGLARDRGYVPLLVGRCHVTLGGRDNRKAIKDAEAALAMDPTNSGAHLCVGMANLLSGHDAMMQGKGAELLDDALAAFSFVLDREGGLSSPLWGRGTVQRYRAVAFERWGQDPLCALAKSEADLSRALTIFPGAADVRSSRGRTRSLRAIWRMRNGQEASDDVASALADFSEALRLQPDREDSHDLAGDLVAHVGLYHLRRGEPSFESFATAEAAFGLVLKDNIKGWPALHRGAMRSWWGRAEARQNRDPLPRWAAAEGDLGAALESLSAFPDPWLRRAQLLTARAEYLKRRNRRRSAADSKAALEAQLRALAIDRQFVTSAGAVDVGPGPIVGPPCTDVPQVVHP